MLSLYKFKCRSSCLEINEKINKICRMDASRYTAEHNTFWLLTRKHEKFCHLQFTLLHSDQNFLDTNNVQNGDRSRLISVPKEVWGPRKKGSGDRQFSSQPGLQTPLGRSSALILSKCFFWKDKYAETKTRDWLRKTRKCRQYLRDEMNVQKVKWNSYFQSQNYISNSLHI